MKNNPQPSLKMDENIMFPQQFTVNEHTDISLSARSHIVGILNKIENTNFRMNKIRGAGDSQVEKNKLLKTLFQKKK